MSTTLKPRTASVVIYQGDDMDRLTELRRTAEIAKRIAEQNEGAPSRIGDDVGSEVKDAQDAYDAFIDEAASRALTVELHSIGRRRFRDLMLEHPPRKVKVKDEPAPDAPKDAPVVEREEDHEDDVAYGVNVETFPEALLTFIDVDDPTKRTIAKPEFSGRNAVRDFLDDEIAEGDFDRLWVSAYYLNRMQSADPESSRYSVARRSTDETSK